ncbi:tRNA (adenosine(37)-N6)-threonylcarbamoyltransferase complex ATPase subunit type 1 TsaE, partial [Limosilactobacillus coleohominis]
MKQLTLNNSNETIALGERMAADLRPGDVVVLNGDLGAGKTTFTKGIAKGLGIKEIIKSPTFTIIHEYQDGRIPLYHMDA